MTPRARAVAAAALAVPVLVLTGCGAPGDGDAAGTTDEAAAAAPEAGTGSSGSTEPAEPEPTELTPSVAQRTGSARPRRPVAVLLPGGEEYLPVSAVDTREDGVLDVPDDVHRLGWWRGGARVGDPFGSVLLAGHVDSTTQGLGDSAVLLTAEAGDRVGVRTTDGVTDYTVRSLRTVPQGSLRDHPELFSSRGPARVTLVTCAPPFVPEEGGYQNLAVVTARPADRDGGGR